MKRVNVSFEADEERRDIDVAFTAAERDDQVEALMARVSDPLASVLTVYDEHGATVSIDESSIVIVTAGNKKQRVICDEADYEIRMSLQDVEAMLNPSTFLRVSRYDIINLAKVQRFDFSVSGTLRIEMKRDVEIWASRRFIPMIKKRLQRKDRP